MSQRFHRTNRRLILTAVLIAGIGVQMALHPPSNSTAAPPSTVGNVTSLVLAATPDFDAAHVKGAQSCKKCHESEYAAWTQTMHFKNHERIASSAGQQYIQKSGSAEACKSCHSTPHDEGAQFAGTAGVSCESCHTPAGGADGWFDIHSDYGGENIKRADETEAHLKARLAATETAGMIRAEDAYALAKNCYSCHIVADEKLLAAGHKPGHGDFSLVPWAQGEVRHNFQVDQKTNAESPSLLKARYGVTAEQRKRTLLVVGKLVELETLLRNLGSISQSNLGEDYAGRRGWAGRAEDVFEFIEEDIADAIDNEQIEGVVKAVKGIDLGRRFEDQAAARSAADQIAELTKAFVDASREQDLSGLDELVDDLDKPKGNSFNP